MILEKIKNNVPLSAYSTLGIGGDARLFLEVETIPEMQEAITYCHEQNLPFFILGKGSNCLFDDQGLDALVILNKINTLSSLEPGCFVVGAGYNFSRLGALTARKGFSGLEFASGIPGTVGGAVFMNAGANGKETCDTLVSVNFIDAKGNLLHYSKDELDFSYRSSSFHQLPGAIVQATFQLTASETAKEKQLEIIEYRKKTQPYKDKSAGCIFRNPQGGSAGALIDQCQLKGFAIGDAKVSNMHANFLINQNHASSKDFLKLIEYIQTQVKQQTGITLHHEVRYIEHV